MGVTSGPTLFIVATLLIPLLAGIFLIYFLVSVMKFMKKKINLDEQRIEQTNQFLELYKNTNDIH